MGRHHARLVANIVGVDLAATTGVAAAGGYVQYVDVVAESETLKPAVGEGVVAPRRPQLRKLKKSNFSDIDKTVALRRSIATSQGRIAKAMETADMTTGSALAAIGSEYANMRIDALRHVGDAA